MPPILETLRPPQWVKNVFVFAALAFGNRLLDPLAVELALLAFAAFCLASSAGYIVNDILDRQRDRLHPVKKDRPIASGRVGVPAALTTAAVLLAGVAGICAAMLPRPLWAAVGAYLALSLLYSLFLKHRMILDVIVIAVLFVLRAVGGAVAIGVQASPWLLICTFMLCMFLGFGKRRCEIAMLSGGGGDIRGHRPLLERYSPTLLTHLLSTSGGIAILTFLLYTLDASHPSPFPQKHLLVYTLPLVVYGIFRYAMLIELGKAVGPTDLIIKDPPFLVAIGLWVLIAAAILYGVPPPSAVSR